MSLVTLDIKIKTTFICCIEKKLPNFLWETQSLAMLHLFYSVQRKFGIFSIFCCVILIQDIAC